jgi:hypothetical protein
VTVTISLRVDDAKETIELLTFVSDVCASDASCVDRALCKFLGGDGYGSADLSADALRLADLIANALGFTDSQMEKTP